MSTFLSLASSYTQDASRHILFGLQYGNFKFHSLEAATLGIYMCLVLVLMPPCPFRFTQAAYYADISHFNNRLPGPLRFSLYPLRLS